MQMTWLQNEIEALTYLNASKIHAAFILYFSHKEIEKHINMCVYLYTVYNLYAVYK